MEYNFEHDIDHIAKCQIAINKNLTAKLRTKSSKPKSRLAIAGHRHSLNRLI
jgi:hypothetical protein